MLTDHPFRRRGSTAVYILICVTGLIALVSLAVDYGRVQIVKTELQRAADAAARAGAAQLPHGDTPAQEAATSTAALNQVDGTPLELSGSDIVCGVWDPMSRTVTPGGFGDAVQVTAVRTAARGNAVPLLFARVVGIRSFDVTATAVAQVAADRVGIIGLDGIDIRGGARIDSFDPDAGPYWQSRSSSALVASNGNITLANNSQIRGDAHPGVGMSVTGGTVTGSRAPLATPLTFPPVSAGTYATNNDNSSIPTQYLNGSNFRLGNNQVLSLPGGTYYLNNVTLNGGSRLNFMGPATFYVTGNLTLSGSVRTAADSAENFVIRKIGAGAVDLTLTGGSQLHVSLYGPQSPIRVNGNGDFFGSLVGRSIEIVGTGGIHHDLSIKGTYKGVVMVR